MIRKLLSLLNKEERKIVDAIVKQQYLDLRKNPPKEMPRITNIFPGRIKR